MYNMTMNAPALNAPASSAFSSKQQSPEEDSSKPPVMNEPVSSPDEKEPESSRSERRRPKKAAVLSAPSSTAFSSRRPAPKEDSKPSAVTESVESENNADDHGASEGAVPDAPKPPPAASLPDPEAEEDEEVRTAMEMALAAAQNPKMSPAELRKLVAEKNKQVGIVDEIQHKKELEKEKEREEAQKRWNQKKDSAMSWWKGTAERVTEAALDVRESAGRVADDFQDRVERRLYADQIKTDPQYQELRKKIKITTKTVKAHRLQGNRIETRHAFKRQRHEKKLLELNKKLSKTHRLFIDSNYNVHEYAKAILRASRKWKKTGTDEELALEAQLCRNMHQMLAIEKQKSKVKKTSRELKKYLQRCKGWLSDKKALCEMHIMTLDATNNSFMLLYEDTLKKQDTLIAKLKNSAEFKGVDLESVDLENWKMLSDKTPGPEATLSALRGLPINDSIRIIKKEHLERDDKPVNGDNRKPPPQAAAAAAAATEEFAQGGQMPELYIETNDDHSVHSQLSDPDGHDGHNSMRSLGDYNHSLDFGNDAPWDRTGSSTPDVGSVEDEEEFSPGYGIISPSKQKEPESPESDSKPRAVSDLDDDAEASADDESEEEKDESDKDDNNDDGEEEPKVGDDDDVPATAEEEGEAAATTTGTSAATTRTSSSTEKSSSSSRMGKNTASSSSQSAASTLEVSEYGDSQNSEKENAERVPVEAVNEELNDPALLMGAQEEDEET